MKLSWIELSAHEPNTNEHDWTRMNRSEHEWKRVNTSEPSLAFHLCSFVFTCVFNIISILK